MQCICEKHFVVPLKIKKTVKLSEIHTMQDRLSKNRQVFLIIYWNLRGANRSTCTKKSIFASLEAKCRHLNHQKRTAILTHPFPSLTFAFVRSVLSFHLSTNFHSIVARAKRHFIATFNEQKTDNKFNLERKRDVKIRTLLCGINQRAIMHSIGKCVRKHTLFIPLVFFSAFVKFSPCLNGDAVQHRASRRLSSDTKFKCTAGKCECE